MKSVCTWQKTLRTMIHKGLFKTQGQANNPFANINHYNSSSFSFFLIKSILDLFVKFPAVSRDMMSPNYFSFTRTVNGHNCVLYS